MQSGFIKLPRALFKEELWSECRRLSHFEAYIDLLRRAAYHPTSLTIQGQMVKIEPGQVVCSAGKLAEQWGWHRSTVWKFLQGLERDGLVDTVACAGATILRLHPERDKDQQNITLTVVEKPLKADIRQPRLPGEGDGRVTHSKNTDFSLKGSVQKQEEEFLEPAAVAEERAFCAFVREAMTGPKPLKYDKTLLDRLRAEFDARRRQAA
jgi:DNA-binding transcriptional regulator YhcF (GntR family)